MWKTIGYTCRDITLLTLQNLERTVWEWLWLYTEHVAIDNETAAICWTGCHRHQTAAICWTGCHRHQTAATCSTGCHRHQTAATCWTGHHKHRTKIATNACYCKPLQWWVTPIPTLWKCWTPTAALWQRLPPAPPPPVPGPGTSVGPQWPSPVTYRFLSSSNCCLFYLSVCEHVCVCVCVSAYMHACAHDSMIFVTYL